MSRLGHGEGVRPRARLEDASGLYTLWAAARLLGVRPGLLRWNAYQNIRGGAALLVRYVRATLGRLPTRSADWYGAVARYSGSKEASVALGFADAVYRTIRRGVSRTTTEGQRVTLPTHPDVRPNRATASSLRLRETASEDADCPPDLDCRFIPAAYEQNDPNNPSSYGNYDLAERPGDGLDIRYIVIHDTELAYDSTIELFQNSQSYVSANYVVRSSDGQVTQMVDNSDIAWHAGNWWLNTHSIGIENEGFALEGATWFTPRLYHSLASLVRYLAEKYDVPLDRMHIVGHDNVPGPTPPTQTAQHWDPGPFFDWDHFMDLLGAGDDGEPGNGTGEESEIVTIDPDFETNEPPLTYCYPDGFGHDDCHIQPVPPQPSNFVYLRTAPSEDAALIQDPGLPGSGTTQADDWGDKAVTGQRFYRADQDGDWTAIHYGGQEAWFYDPEGRSSAPGTGTLVTPAQGLDSIQVYGRAYPEPSAYPPSVPAQAIVPLQYSIPTGQVYVAEDVVDADYYYTGGFTTDPSTHSLVRGEDQYYEISFNHRLAYLRASDVVVVSETG